MIFTPDQQKIIDLREKNILVSAAAGSGKTAVLVERILQKICDEQKPVDVDRLLIVTFTNGAAAGMKKKISQAIRNKLLSDSNNEHLQRQGILLNHGNITTIHSFCLSVLRNHFQIIGLDPSFRIADEGELNLLRGQVVKEVLEEAFKRKEPGFYHFVESFAPKKTDDILEELILKLYHFSMSDPNPKQWLITAKNNYDIKEGASLQELSWFQDVWKEIKNNVLEMKVQIEQAASYCLEEDGPLPYLDAIQSYENLMHHLEKCTSFSEYREALLNKNVKSLVGKRAASADQWKKNRVKEIRDKVKKRLEILEKEYFFAEEEKMLMELRACGQSAKELVDLTLQFIDGYTEAKRERNIIDFSDLEHLTLQILVKEENGKFLPRETAKEYMEYFDEIMIDEYQDSNYVQECILSSISKEPWGRYNYFMVGDVKQSIYKFRLARPEIFMEKYEKYTEEDSPMQKVNLHKNFRSRKEVLSMVNFMMKQVMGRDLGGIEYDQLAALHLGADYPDPVSKNANDTELLLVCGEEEGISPRELEAKLIAKKIKDIVGNQVVVSKEYEENKEDAKEKGIVYRKAKYRDIVILLRTNAGWDQVFYKVLTEAGIPVHIGSKTGYFSSAEVGTALDFLRILDNPLQDIPLMNVMKSIWGEFTDEEIAILSIGRQKKCLYKRLLEGSDEILLQEKTNRFLSLIQKYRRMLPYTTVNELLLALYEEKGFYYYMGALPGGRQRRANLDMLLERAGDFEKISFKGLFYFVRYIEGLKQYDIDYGEASVLGEEDNVVRIMSIHKSKGLEFPICFLSGIHKTFHEMDLRKSVIMDPDLGIGMDYVDPKLRMKAPTILKRVMGRKGKIDNIGEELRLLYVAMTRAKEKLIFTGYIKDLEKQWKKISSIPGREEEKLRFSIVSEAGSYLELLLAALARHPGFLDVVKKEGIETDIIGCFTKDLPPLQIKICSIQELVEGEIEEEVCKEEKEVFYKEMVKRIEEGDVFSKNMREQIEKRFSYEYPHPSSALLYKKISVTELKRMEQRGEDEEGERLYQEPILIPYIPQFIETAKEGLGAMRGTAYHKVMELLDFGREYTQEELKGFFETIKNQGKIQEKVLDYVDKEDIEKFLHTSLAKRMQEAYKKGRLKREQPFVLEYEAKRIHPSFPEGERILVQGIIDAYFEEDDGLVLLDYKTDRGKSEEELAELYRVQLDYYAEAMERLTEKRVKEKGIYSFGLHKVILLSC